MKSQIKTLGFFFRPDNQAARRWQVKLTTWLRKHYPLVTITHRQPQALVILGGDGTIIEAARKNAGRNTIMLGLNLGHVGFLASARQPKQFLPALTKLLTGNFRIVPRMTFTAQVLRKQQTIFTTNIFNDLAVQNPLGMVELAISISGHNFQRIRGSGVLVATATGSTAFNLSAHGPIVMPDIKCMIVTEILDHNIPTPSIVLTPDRAITIKVITFRERNLLALRHTGQSAETMLIADGETVFPLQKGDQVVVSASTRALKFAEVEEHYFLKSLQEKFTFK